MCMHVPGWTSIWPGWVTNWTKEKRKMLYLPPTIPGRKLVAGDTEIEENDQLKACLLESFD